ncbi:MAG: hypothetical protein RIE31_04505 [Alphaproteobacteria bacterium]
MSAVKLPGLVIVAALVLAGCSFASESLWPTLTGASPAPTEGQTSQGGQTVAIAPSAGEASGDPTVAPVAPPLLNTGTFEPGGVTPGVPTNTFVGQKVVTLRSELQRLQTNLAQRNQSLQNTRGRVAANAQRYFGLMAAIMSRLQVGTTPGNPILQAQWNQAQVELETINGTIGEMSQLANGVAADASLSAFLLESTRATFGLQGAIDEDHRQLSILEDEVNRTVVTIDRLLNELSEDISRQSIYVNRERGNLNTLALAIKNGELFGTSLSNRAFTSSVPQVQAPAQAASLTGRQPLVVIRFDNPNVEYEQALFTAMSRAMERRPDAIFDLVAVSPAQGTTAQVTLNANAARRNAEAVLRSLGGMGLPADRVTLSALSSPNVQSNEVHVYIR